MWPDAPKSTTVVPGRALTSARPAPSASRTSASYVSLPAAVGNVLKSPPTTASSAFVPSLSPARAAFARSMTIRADSRLAPDPTWSKWAVTAAQTSPVRRSRNRASTPVRTYWDPSHRFPPALHGVEDR